MSWERKEQVRLANCQGSLLHHLLQGQEPLLPLPPLLLLLLPLLLLLLRFWPWLTWVSEITLNFKQLLLCPRKRASLLQSHSQLWPGATSPNPLLKFLCMVFCHACLVPWSEDAIRS